LIAVKINLPLTTGEQWIYLPCVSDNPGSEGRWAYGMVIILSVFKPLMSLLFIVLRCGLKGNSLS
jgi:hypothetical protein